MNRSDQFTNLQAEIIRDPITKTATLHILTDGNWTVFKGNSLKDIDMDNPLLRKKGSGVFPLDISHTKRYLFRVFSEECSKTLAENHLPLEGAYNFRDLGGIKNKEGKMMRWGSLFRSDEMNELTASDLIYLESTKLKTIIDFRTAAEKKGNRIFKKAPNKLPPSVKNKITLPIKSGDFFSNRGILKIIKSSERDLKAIMDESYRKVVSDAHFVNTFKNFFHHLQNPKNSSINFHCSAGKDRTGITTMLLLSALDFDKETVMQDYLKSQKYITRKYDRYLSMASQIKPLITVDKSYLHAAYDEIDKTYGSLDNFLTQTLEIDRKKLKELYLY